MTPNRPLPRPLPSALVLAVAVLPPAACSDGGGGRAADATGDGPPTAEERIARWEDDRPGMEVPVSVSFGEVVPDSAVAAYLQRHSLTPYAVYRRAGGLTGAYREPRSAASLEVLARARDRALADMQTSLCAQQGRARAMLGAGEDGGASPGRPDDPPGGAAVAPERARAVLGLVERLREALPRVERGEPVVYGVEALGTPSDVRSALSDPAATVEPAQVVGDTAGVPRPPEPAPRDDGPAPGVARLDSAALLAGLEALAGNSLEECHDAPVPPGRETPGGG